ncbi:hypothetical protein M2447_002765, partial [Ereboglobus sp. PH5-10]|nr:hypothetical protein [Ereboglobus sp. PH5-10]
GERKSGALAFPSPCSYLIYPRLALFFIFLFRLIDTNRDQLVRKSFQKGKAEDLAA